MNKFPRRWRQHDPQTIHDQLCGCDHMWPEIWDQWIVWPGDLYHGMLKNTFESLEFKIINCLSLSYCFKEMFVVIQGDHNQKNTDPN